MKKDIIPMENSDTGKKITRKQAIQKAGITALTAASLLFLDTKKASAASLKPTAPNAPSTPSRRR